MTNAGDNRVFLDTNVNVLVYANAAAAPLHHQALSSIQGYYDAGVELWISRQVLGEFLCDRGRSRPLLPNPFSRRRGWPVRDGEACRFDGERFN